MQMLLSAASKVHRDTKMWTGQVMTSPAYAVIQINTKDTVTIYRKSLI